MVSPGNHEFWFNFAAYKHRFTMPNSNGGDGWGHYSLDINGVHIAAINTESPVDVAFMSKAQVDWMAADLANSKNASWKIVYGHRPLYCSNHGGQDIPAGNKFLQLAAEKHFIEESVDLVLQGHVHDYERTLPIKNDQPTSNDYTNPTAPVYVVNGAAGNRERND